MNCKKFEALLQELIESRQPELPPHCEDHVAGCAHCRALWEQSVVLHCLIPLWNADVPEIDLTEPILRALQLDEAARTVSAARESQPISPLQPAVDSPSLQVVACSEETPVLSKRQGWAVIAMTMVVLVLAFQLMLSSRTTIPDASPVAVNSPSEFPWAPQVLPSAVTETEPAPGVNGFVMQAGSAYRSLGSEFASGVVDVSILFPADIRLSALGEPSNPDESLNPAAPWSEQLKPVQQRLGKALDFLRDAVPAAEAPAT